MNSCRSLSISRRTKSSEEASSTSQRRNLSTRTSSPLVHLSFFHAEKRQHLSSRCLFLFSFLYDVFFFFFFCFSLVLFDDKKNTLDQKEHLKYSLLFSISSTFTCLPTSRSNARNRFLFAICYFTSMNGDKKKKRQGWQQTNIKPIDQSLRRRAFFCLSVCVLYYNNNSVWRWRCYTNRLETKSTEKENDLFLGVRGRI